MRIAHTLSWMRPARGWLLRVALTVSLALSVGACSTLQGVLVPVDEPVPGTSQVDMLVATTRKKVDPVQMFSGDRGPGAAFANITVSIPPASARQVGEVQWPSKVPGNPAKDFVTLKADVIDRAQALAWFHRTLRKTPKRQVLVFIHGFNNRFEDAVFRFAQIVHDSQAPVVPILFTWPSRGSVLAYGYDRESTAYSRNALENLLKAISSDPSVGEISILAHSMGNSLALETLRQMAIRDGRVASKIRNVLLAAPDVDVDLAREAIADMGSKGSRPSFTLFVSQDDRALALSRRVWGSAARLGAINPDQEPYRTQLEQANVTVLDLTKLQAGDALNHGKFAESPEVVQLIGKRLAEGQTVTDSRMGLGDRIIQVTAGAAAAVGTAAGLAVSAPVAVVDPQTRQTFGDHVQELGNSAASVVTP
ncbi:esterase/lipase superfamily enzyme [Microvirga flocculans]|uniref:Esterase/lipase superfamily enzyme n=2 Tax=Microvirga flocculans TaxID=217168 RepID=A0A7W6IHV1_9HYPH|nr:alpha/beta hydrolase [Microvirga flocculans]MBB4041772.1 esterase/lipase superfamily enzyme [Microvirga flocculans]